MDKDELNARELTRCYEWMGKAMAIIQFYSKDARSLDLLDLDVLNKFGFELGIDLFFPEEETFTDYQSFDTCPQCGEIDPFCECPAKPSWVNG